MREKDLKDMDNKDIGRKLVSNGSYELLLIDFLYKIWYNTITLVERSLYE